MYLLEFWYINILVLWNTNFSVGEYFCFTKQWNQDSATSIRKILLQVSVNETNFRSKIADASANISVKLFMLSTLVINCNWRICGRNNIWKIKKKVFEARPIWIRLVGHSRVDFVSHLAKVYLWSRTDRLNYFK